MKKNDLKIGLALSGGGMRAAIYHLGVLKCLAEKKLLKNVTKISTVSGASIAMGLIYSCNHNLWPSDEQYLDEVLPQIKTIITKVDIQWRSIGRLIVKPYYWDKKVNLLGNVMEEYFHISGCIDKIKNKPLWIINTTCFESGKDFRISSKRMGEKSMGYVLQPHLRLSHAVAASAGFPILIGPYKLKTSKYEWVNKAREEISATDKTLHLWDGGVYDNMGLDPLFDGANYGSFSHHLNYLIVSNASGNIGHKSRVPGFSIANLKRLLDINMDQVEQLRSQNVIDYFLEHHNGLYLKIGTSTKEVLKYSNIECSKKELLIKQSMSKEELKLVQSYPTTLGKVSKHCFDLILNHGYELTQATVNSFAPTLD